MAGRAEGAAAQPEWILPPNCTCGARRLPVLPQWSGQRHGGRNCRLALLLRFRLRLCRQHGRCGAAGWLLRVRGCWGLRRVRARARWQRFNWRRASRAQPTCALAGLTSLAGAAPAGEGWALGAGWAGSGCSMGARPSLPASAMPQGSDAGC